MKLNLLLNITTNYGYKLENEGYCLSPSATRIGFFYFGSAVVALQELLA